MTSRTAGLWSDDSLLLTSMDMSAHGRSFRDVSSKLTALCLATVVLCACSGDPALRKQRYLRERQ